MKNIPIESLFELLLSEFSAVTEEIILDGRDVWYWPLSGRLNLRSFSTSDRKGRFGVNSSVNSTTFPLPLPLLLLLRLLLTGGTASVNVNDEHELKNDSSVAYHCVPLFVLLPKPLVILLILVDDVIDSRSLTFLIFIDFFFFNFFNELVLDELLLDWYEINLKIVVNH